METGMKHIFISSTLRSRVNVLAHELAIKHESTLRSVMLLELGEMVKSGVALEAQHHYLDTVAKIIGEKISLPA